MALLALLLDVAYTPWQQTSIGVSGVDTRGQCHLDMVKKNGKPPRPWYSFIVFDSATMSSLMCDWSHEKGFTRTAADHITASWPQLLSDVTNTDWMLLWHHFNSRNDIRSNVSSISNKINKTFWGRKSHPMQNRILFCNSIDILIISIFLKCRSVKNK